MDSKNNEARQPWRFVLAILLTVLGIGALIVFCIKAPDVFKGYLEGDAPFYGIGCGVLIAAGVLVYERRFSLQRIVIAMFIIAGAGTVGTYAAVHWTQSEIVSSTPLAAKDAAEMFNHTLLPIFVRRRGWNSNDPPITIQIVRDGALMIKIKPYKNKDVRNVGRILIDFLIFKKLAADRPPTAKAEFDAVQSVVSDAVDGFGDDIALEIIEACVQDNDLAVQKEFQRFYDGYLARVSQVKK